MHDFEQDLAIAQSKCLATARQLEELASTAADHLPLRDLASCEAEAEKIEFEKTRRASEQGSLSQQLDTLSSTIRRLTELKGELDSLESRFAVAGKLAAVAAGKAPHNLTGVNFSRFILAVQMDEVLQHASHRLQIMSRGRFSLRRIQGRDDRQYECRP